MGRGRKWSKAMVGTRPEDITPEQYEKAWKMYESGIPKVQIISATNLTTRQFHYLLSNPLPKDPENCPSFVDRFTEITLKVRSRATESAESLSESAVRGIKRMADISLLSQEIVYGILQDWAMRTVENRKLGSNALHYEDLIPSKKTQDALKTLKDYSDFRNVAEAWRRIYDSPAKSLDGLSGAPGGAKADISSGALPAITTTLYELESDQRSGEASDILDELIQDFDEWSDNEIEEFLNNFKWPSHKTKTVLDVKASSKPHEDDPDDDA